MTCSSKLKVEELRAPGSNEFLEEVWTLARGTEGKERTESNIEQV